MAGPRRHPLFLALGAALLLGLAGRVALGALRSAPDVPHSGALTAVGAAVVALGAPWLAAAWVVGALAGSRRGGAPPGGPAARGRGPAGGARPPPRRGAGPPPPPPPGRA